MRHDKRIANLELLVTILGVVAILLGISVMTLDQRINRLEFPHEQQLIL